MHLKNYQEIQENLIRRRPEKGRAVIKLPPNRDWIYLYGLSILFNFFSKVNETFTLAAAPQF